MPPGGVGREKSRLRINLDLAELKYNSFAELIIPNIFFDML